MCEFCERTRSIPLHRKENLGMMCNPYIVQCPDGAGMFFENAEGDPAYIDIDYCPKCGRKLDTIKLGNNGFVVTGRQ